MKATADHGYPYPECDPPYVKDKADLPAQLKALAELVDDDITSINAQATAELNPPLGLLSLTAAEALGPSAFFKFTQLTTILANIGGICDATNAQFVIPSAGLYWITGTAASTAAPNGVHRLGFRLNGSVFRAETIQPNAAAGTQIRNNSVTPVFCSPGDIVDMVQYQPGAGNVTYQTAQFGIYRMVAT